MFHGENRAMNPGEGEREEKPSLLLWLWKTSSAAGKPDKDEELFV